MDERDKENVSDLTDPVSVDRYDVIRPTVELLQSTAHADLAAELVVREVAEEHHGEALRELGLEQFAPQYEFGNRASDGDDTAQNPAYENLRPVAEDEPWFREDE